MTKEANKTQQLSPISFKHVATNPKILLVRFGQLSTPELAASAEKCAEAIAPIVQELLPFLEEKGQWVIGKDLEKAVNSLKNIATIPPGQSLMRRILPGMKLRELIEATWDVFEEGSEGQKLMEKLDAEAVKSGFLKEAAQVENLPPTPKTIRKR